MCIFSLLKILFFIGVKKTESWEKSDETKNHVTEVRLQG